MDGSSAIFIVMPIVIGITLAIMIALPYIGGREQARASAADRRRGAEAIAATAPRNAPAAGTPSSAPTITATVAASSESPEENGTT